MERKQRGIAMLTAFRERIKDDSRRILLYSSLKTLMGFVEKYLIGDCLPSKRI